MQMETLFKPDRSLQMTTPGSPAVLPFQTPTSPTVGFMGGIDPALLSKLVEAKLRRNAAPPQAENAFLRRPEYTPEMGSSVPNQSAFMQQFQKKPLRYSYQFTAPNQWAGNAPVLPMQVGLQGREGEDFILEGGDVRSLVNAPRGAGAGVGMSPADDPRMRALTSSQNRARGLNDDGQYVPEKPTPVLRNPTDRR